MQGNRMKSLGWICIRKGVLTSTACTASGRYTSGALYLEQKGATRVSQSRTWDQGDRRRQRDERAGNYLLRGSRSVQLEAACGQIQGTKSDK